MKKINNKGFTLIELLTTICVLSLVASITISFGLNIIKAAKEKSYKVTKNNIEQAAVSYLKENNDIEFLSTNNIEYQCIKIKNLIDYGYFDNELLNAKYNDEDTVNKEQYIYIERDKTTKTVKSSNFPAQDGYCSSISNHNKQIIINYDTGWAKSKKVTITFKLNSVANIDDIKSYNYLYTINGGDKIEDVFDNKIVTKTFTVNTNSEIYSKIYNENDSVNKFALVDKIDNISPLVGELNGDIEPSITKNILVTITDNASGFNSNDTSLSLKYGFSISNKTKPEILKDANLVYNECNNTNNECKNVTFNALYEEYETGNYYLWVIPNMKDMAGNVVDQYVSNGTYKVGNVTCTLTAPSGYDSSKVLTINTPVTSGVTYSFDGITYNEINTKTVNATGIYTGYVKNSSGTVSTCSTNVVSRTEYRTKNCRTASWVSAGTIFGGSSCPANTNTVAYYWETASQGTCAEHGYVSEICYNCRKYTRTSCHINCASTWSDWSTTFATSTCPSAGNEPSVYAENRTAYATSEVVDNTAPTCSFGSWSNSSVTSGALATIALTCTDNETGISTPSLSSTDFTIGGTGSLELSTINANTGSSTRTYTITVQGDDVGEPTITLLSGKVLDGAGNTNASVTSSSLTVNPYVLTCDLTTPVGYDTSKVLTIEPSSTSGVTYSFDGTNFSSTTTKTVSTTGTYTGYVKDASGTVNSCSITINSRKEYSSRNCRTATWVSAGSSFVSGSCPSNTNTVKYTRTTGTASVCMAQGFSNGICYICAKQTRTSCHINCASNWSDWQTASISSTCPSGSNEVSRAVRTRTAIGVS